MARIQYIPNRVIDTNGISDGAQVHVYQSGTTTHVALFSDSGLTVAITNPIVVPAGAEIPVFYTSYTGQLRLKVIESDGTISQDDDPYSGPVAASDLAAPDSSSLVGFIQDGDGAVNRNSLAKQRERVTIEDFGGVGDGVADDTAALNKFLAKVSTGACGTILSKTYRFTAALDPVAAEYVKITGEGGLLLYDGVSTTSDLMTFGDGTNKFRNIDLRGFRIHSNTLMTSGTAIKLRKCDGVDVDVIFGDEYGTWRIYDGLWLENCTNIRLHSSHFCALHDGVKWNGGYELHMMNSYVKGLVVSGQGTGTGIHCGGACGGFYSENVTQLLNDVGVRIDTTLTNSGNFQFFFYGGTFDTNKTASLFVDDSFSDSLSKVIVVDDWMASSTNPGNGGGIVISNWRDGSVNVDGQIINHTGTAVYSADSTVRLTIGRNALIRDNGGYAVHSLTAWTVDVSAIPRNNALGAYSSNITNRNLLIGSQASAVDPTKLWAFDITGAGPRAVVASGTVVLSAGSGLIIVQNDTTGEGGIFFTYGGNVTKVAGGATIVSGAPGASQIGLQFLSGAYTVINGYASTQNIYVGGVRGRATS